MDALTSAAYQHYRQHSDEIVGWVEPGFFSTLEDIEAMLRKHAVTGSVAEIGVHCGKLLLAMALVSGDRPQVLAVDNFENGQGIRQNLESNIARFYDPALVSIVETDSMKTSGRALLEKLPQHAKYFSVDGYHQAEFVFNDLMIAQDVICNGGVVIVDDYLSPAWIGVLEAVFEFCRSPARKIAPFAYGENKLLLTTLQQRDAYFEHFKALDGRHATRIGSYSCAYFKPDTKWFAGTWNANSDN